MITKEEREEVLTKIEKLMSHTKTGTNGAVNVNEMAVANKIVKELMDKYDISIDEIKTTSDKSTLVKGFDSHQCTNKVVEKWILSLSSSVASFYDCRIIQSTKKLSFVGFETDANVATKMFDYLYIQIRVGSYKATKEKSFVDKKIRRRDFCVGAMSSLRIRLEEMRNERKSQEVKNALIIVKKDVVDNQINVMYPRLKYSTTRIKYTLSNDYSNGVQFGKTMSIHKSELLTK